ncbi:MAG: helix-turn-helix domain-containing protein [Pseudonocardiaceae bacterium]
MKSKENRLTENAGEGFGPIRTMGDLRDSSRATITRDEASAVLEIDPRTVTVGIEDGTIPAIRIGRRLVIPRERFLALLEAAPTSEQKSA